MSDRALFAEGNWVRDRKLRALFEIWLGLSVSLRRRRKLNQNFVRGFLTDELVEIFNHLIVLKSTCVYIQVGT